MRLHSISFQNFKSFRDETTIPLGRITYLIGPNGAGKSNVLHGLKTLSAIITRDDYAPEPGDYFNNGTDREMKLAAVVELSDAERQAIAARIKAPSAALPRIELGRWLFKYLKYESTFSGPLKTHTVLLTFVDGDYHEFISLKSSTGGGKCTVTRRSVETINMADKSLPEPESYNTDQTTTIATLLAQIDQQLVSRINDLFSEVTHTTTQRSIPKRTPVHESRGITSDGSNIFNELNDFSRDTQIDFDKFLSAMADGSIRSVEPKVRGSELALEAAEPDLDRKTPHTDLGSGQKQLVLLALQLFTRPGSIFMLAEPELHLHAKAQKRVHARLKDASAKLQIIIETHSPIFLGTDQGEATVLLTKDQGHSHVTPITRGNMDVIRHELGITHHDSLYHTNILFVEGHSEHAAFPKFLSTLGYHCAPETAVFNLEGVGRIRHLRQLLCYFNAEDRRVFVILDGNDTARSSIASLKQNGILAQNSFILENDFEDAFESKTIIDAASAMAQKIGLKFDFTAADLDRQRGEGKSVTAVLKKHWRKTTGRDLNKVDLAKSLATLPCAGIPGEIKNALQTAMAYFGEEGGGAPKHEQERENFRPENGTRPRKTTRSMGDSYRSSPPQGPLGEAASGLLRGRGILSANDNFAANAHFSHLYSPLPNDDEKPVILFTAIPHQLGDHGIVTTGRFAEWVGGIRSIEVGGNEIPVRGLEQVIDHESLTVAERHPYATDGKDVKAYREFHVTGLFEYGTSHRYLYRNDRGDLSMGLCHMIGDFWGFLLHTRMFYQKIGQDGPFTVILSIRNSSSLALGNYGDEATDPNWGVLRRFSHVPADPRTNHPYIRLSYAFGPISGMTDSKAELVAKDAARAVCNAYGQDAPKCYDELGQFSWTLWEMVSR